MKYLCGIECSGSFVWQLEGKRKDFLCSTVLGELWWKESVCHNKAFSCSHANTHTHTHTTIFSTELLLLQKNATTCPTPIFYPNPAPTYLSFRSETHAVCKIKTPKASRISVEGQQQRQHCHLFVVLSKEQPVPLNSGNLKPEGQKGHFLKLHFLWQFYAAL